MPKVTWLGDPAEPVEQIEREGVTLTLNEAVEVPDNWPLLEAAKNSERFKVEGAPAAPEEPKETEKETSHKAHGAHRKS